VRTSVAGLNAKGACIGPMGQRVRNVVAELHGEKIDIVDWAADPATYVGNALSPAHALESRVVDRNAMSVRVVVPDFQLSLAIGREGQNARLAARLTGWRIDIHSDAEGQNEARTEARTEAGTADGTADADADEVDTRSDAPADAQADPQADTAGTQAPEPGE
jgi:transcription termination/antitermination protein NusA